MAISLRAIVLLSCLLSQVRLAQSTICYDTNGLPNEKYFPCDLDITKNASCCAAGDICFSNGLCSPSQARKDANPEVTFVTDLYRDSCTDPSFQDPKCLSECFDEGHQGITKCAATKYCCYGNGNGCDCNNATQVVTFPDGAVISTIDLNGTAVTLAVTFPSQQDQGKKSSAVPIGVGVGVGVGGAVLIAVAATIFVLRRRRRQKVSSPSFGPQPKYETKPDKVHHEMTTVHNTTELSSATATATPLHELPVPDEWNGSAKR